MKFRFIPIFAKAEEPSRSQSGGRGSATPSAAAQTVAAGGKLPLDSPDLACGKAVTIQLEKGGEIKGFKDPVYGWMDANGVKLPEGSSPVSWSPL